MSFNIAICCCTYLFGEGIKNLIEQDGLGNVAVINCSEPKEVIKANPDLLITDFNNLSSISIDTLSKQKVGIVLLGTGCLPKIENERLMDFISKGLVGILSPNTDSVQFKKAVKSVLSGEFWLNRKKISNMLSEIKDLKTETKPSFTKREVDIIQMICKGYCNKDIMKSLNISEPSVKKQLNTIYSKVGVSGRLQLAIYAFRYLPDLIRVT